MHIATHLTPGWLRIAAAEVGAREAGGNNRGPRIEEYQHATWLTVGPWAWCAAFCCWVLREWLKTPEGAVFLDGARLEEWRCKDALAFGWEKWARQRGLTVISENGVPKPGDFVVFDWSHIGIVEDVSDWPRTITTIEGNTNVKGQRDSLIGDGVWRKARKPSPENITCYIRLERAP